MAAVFQYAPSRSGRFLRCAFEPGTTIGDSTAVVLIAIHVTPEFYHAYTSRVADVTEEESTTSHHSVSIVFGGYTLLCEQGKQGLCGYYGLV